MSDETFRLASKLALAICVIAVASLAFAPLSGPVLFDYDKANHLIAFAVMAGLANLGWPGLRSAPFRWMALIGYGVLIELVQRELPFRDFSLLDVVADTIGIASYSLLKLLAVRFGFVR